MIGRTVGNYRIVKILGKGGMGIVYEAEHKSLPTRAALKVLNDEYAQDPTIVNRFFSEARVLASIKHSGVVKVLDHGQLESGAWYLIMELLDGQSLADRLAVPGGISIAESRDVAAQAANILAAVHARQIVHRDLKPDNIYLVRDNDRPRGEMVKILDFGIAKLRGELPRTGVANTQTGSFLGTPAYMSPEQCKGTKDVDHRSDIYSLGVILYELVCHEPPFKAEGLYDLMHLHISVPPAAPRSRNPNVPEDLETVILRCLQKDPAQRYQLMTDVETALSGRAARVPTLAEPLASQPSSVNSEEHRVSSSSVVPVSAGTPPMNAGTLPKSGFSLPVSAGIPPMSAGTLPKSAVTLPMSARTLPMSAGTVPMSAGTVPMSAGTLPMKASTIPMSAGTVPMNASTNPAVDGPPPASGKTRRRVVLVIGAVAIVAVAVFAIVVLGTTDRPSDGDGETEALAPAAAGTPLPSSSIAPTTPIPEPAQASVRTAEEPGEAKTRAVDMRREPGRPSRDTAGGRLRGRRQEVAKVPARGSPEVPPTRSDGLGAGESSVPKATQNPGSDEIETIYPERKRP
jgi:serine/threonine-protein kinase